MPTNSSNNTLEPVRPATLYPLPIFQTITGLGDHAMRTARNNGLRVRRLGGRAYVWSGDFFEYLNLTGTDKSEPET